MADSLEHLVAGLLHDAGARVIVLVDPVSEAHQPERVVPVLGAFDIVRDAVDSADLHEQLSNGTVSRRCIIFRRQRSYDPSSTMNRKPDPYGRDATRPFQIPLKGWWQVAQRVWSESNRDNLSVVAAGCAFFALFAIFPALSALISLYGLTADPVTVEQQFRMLGSVLPAQAPLRELRLKALDVDPSIDMKTRYGLAKDQAKKEIDDWYGSQSW